MYMKYFKEEGRSSLFMLWFCCSIRVVFILISFLSLIFLF